MIAKHWSDWASRLGLKYSDDQPRDDKGRWTDGGAGSGADASLRAANWTRDGDTWTHGEADVIRVADDGSWEHEREGDDERQGRIVASGESLDELEAYIEHDWTAPVEDERGR